MVELLIGGVLAWALYKAVSKSQGPLLEPNGNYAFVIRAQVGALPTDPNTMPMVSALLLSTYALQTSAIGADASDPTVWRGNAHYLGNENMNAKDTTQIKIISLAKVA